MFTLQSTSKTTGRMICNSTHNIGMFNPECQIHIAYEFAILSNKKTKSLSLIKKGQKVGKDLILE